MVELDFEIREHAGRGHGLELELRVEGRKVATATASSEALAELHAQLGLDREEVARELRSSLEDLLKHRLAKVSISQLREDPRQRLRFQARYTYRDHDAIETGLVAYDVSASTTEPGSLPAVVANAMRNEVHRLLTSPGSTARALVDM